MANLEDGITAWVNANASEKTKIKEILEITKNFAKDFSLWKENQVQQNEDGKYFGESTILISRTKPIDINSLMDIFIEEKRLFDKYTK